MLRQSNAMSSASLKQGLMSVLLSLPCHFTWKELADLPRTVETKFENYEEHIQQTIKGIEVESYNLLGFYKTQNKSFIQAREYFNKALENVKTDDEKIVCLSCLVWLTWREQGWDYFIYQEINEVKKIIRKRDAEVIPEVLIEKAFSIAHSGIDQTSHAEEAYRCINKALSETPNNMKAKFIKGIVMKDLYKATIVPLSPLDDVELLEMKQNWLEIRETREESKGFNSNIYVMSLIEYATFLHKFQRDNGESGRKIAEQAERILEKFNCVAIMRNLAEFYLFSAKHNTKILDKAENILDRILIVKPDCSRTLQLRGQLFFDKYRFTAKKDKEKYFDEAKASFFKSWKSSGKTVVTPALELARIYQRKFEETDDPRLLLDVENLFREIHEDIDKLPSSSKALVHEAYGTFLKAHHKKLVLSHLKKSFQHQPVLENQQPKHPLWDLARELMLSPELMEQREGAKTIEWMNDLLGRRIPTRVVI